MKRRRRKKKRKPSIWKSWSWERRGLEFREMQAFVDQPQDRVQMPNGEWRMLERGQDVVQIMTFDPEPVYVPSGEADANPSFDVQVWRVTPRSEGRFFYGGANRRYRRLTPILVREA